VFFSSIAYSPPLGNFHEVDSSSLRLPIHAEVLLPARPPLLIDLPRVSSSFYGPHWFLEMLVVSLGVKILLGCYRTTLCDMTESYDCTYELWIFRVENCSDRTSACPTGLVRPNWTCLPPDRTSPTLHILNTKLCLTCFITLFFTILYTYPCGMTSRIKPPHQYILSQRNPSRSVMWLLERGQANQRRSRPGQL
jgi:hypothetical protein